MFLDTIDTLLPEIDDPWLTRLLSWADEIRSLDVWTNADYPQDAERALKFGANGIGLCRTEHMFFATERLPVVQRMIMATSSADRDEALDELLPLQRSDFAGLFRVMGASESSSDSSIPPPRVPAKSGRSRQGINKPQDPLMRAEDLHEVNALVRELEETEHILSSVEALHESNPMLGLRGVRLAILVPAIPEMQIRAIFEAAALVLDEGIEPRVGIMIPLASDAAELLPMKEIVDRVADEVLGDRADELDYEFGSMIETPRAAVTAGAIASSAEFFSFGTNDLTQMTFGISRDDAEKAFLMDYLKLGVLARNPFDTLDRDGVGALIRSAVAAGRAARPGSTSVSAANTVAILRRSPCATRSGSTTSAVHLCGCPLPASLQPKRSSTDHRGWLPALIRTRNLYKEWPQTQVRNSFPDPAAPSTRAFP